MYIEDLWGFQKPTSVPNAFRNENWPFDKTRETRSKGKHGFPKKNSTPSKTWCLATSRSHLIHNGCCSSTRSSRSNGCRRWYLQSVCASLVVQVDLPIPWPNNLMMWVWVPSTLSPKRGGVMIWSSYVWCFLCLLWEAWPWVGWRPEVLQS